jgi:dihydroxy-acid dehydratase
MTYPAFENAIRAIAAVGGSTNAIIHMIAIARRLGIHLPLEIFDRLSRETPFLANLRPAGKYQMEDFDHAGGVPVLLKELEPLLHTEVITCTGRTLGEELAHVPRRSEVYADIIHPRDDPLHPDGGLAILYGNLAPNGAVIKPKAANQNLLQHTGRAVVFTSLDDLEARIDDPDLDVEPDDVLVLQNAGPVGAPGMPEAGMLPIPRKLLAKGVRDMVRISDCRMSGTAFGTVVLHVAPEAAVGGPLALVQNGDMIELDVVQRKLNLLVDEAEMERRRVQWRPPTLGGRGWAWLYRQHVLQADQGCDFDFLTSGFDGVVR